MSPSDGGFRLPRSAAAASTPQRATWKRCWPQSGASVLAVVDAGPLYAVADADDEDHEACREVLARGDLRLVIPAMAIAEATYFVGQRLGALAEARFLRGLGSLDVEGPAPEDLGRMAQLVSQYA